MPKRVVPRTHPAHADVWLRPPVWTSRKKRLAVAGVIVAAALGSLAGAGGAARRVDAATAQSPANTQSTEPPTNTQSFGNPVATDLPSFSSPVGLPPTVSATPITVPDPTPSGALAPQLAGDGIPAVALDAYRKAAAHTATTAPACGIPWPLLAAIGRVESDHGRFADSQLYADGTSAPRVIGIPLNGNGTALITDTDGGKLDGDTTYDRAVGPMQFIPSTWAHWGVDGNGDGVISPFNIYDAALAAADYLCSAGGNLGTAAGQIRAVLAYNHSDAYLALVLSLEKVYATGVPGVTIPILPSDPKPKPHDKPLPPPVDPGHPRGLQQPHHKPKPPAHSGGSSSAPSSPTDKAPTAAFTVAPKPGAPLDVGADARASKDDHGIKSYTFYFGDNTPTVTVTPPSVATVDHAYTSDGTFTVTVTVTDTAGNRTTAVNKVTVFDNPPTALLTVAPLSGAAPLTVTADASTSTDSDDPIASYTFDFGDKKPNAIVTVTPPLASAQYTYAEAGTYIVTVTVRDTAGKTSTTTQSVTVSASTSTPTDTTTPTDPPTT